MANSKILVIDDDADIRSACRIVLEKAGYAVREAPTAGDGRRQIEKERPDLIILDIMMEESDAGIQLARWLAEKHAGLPVIMLSSIADAAEQTFDTSTLKVAELLNKPVAPQILLESVKRLLIRTGR
ncbi:MAG: response regulator [Myxococcales bacterium]|nr:response regulator [Myxococcales bacterium]